MRRAPQEERTYFTTFSTWQRLRLFQVHSNATLMAETLMHYRNQGRYALHAYVVMPDHVHALITPAPDVSLEKAIQLMKGGFSFRLKSRSEVWERGHFDKRVSDRNAYAACLNYIHHNPVVARIAETDSDYPFSSATLRSNMDPIPTWFYGPDQG